VIDQAMAERFAENLRAERARARLSQDVLAFRAEVHRTQISQMESAQRLPRLDVAVKLATVLGIGVEALVDGIAYEPRTVMPGDYAIESPGQDDG